MTSLSRSAARQNNLDLMRLLLAMTVILSHAFQLVRNSYDDEPVARLTGGRLTFGALAVDCFFIISGYLITQSWDRSSSATAYFKRRLLRIVPGVLATMLLCGLVLVPMVSAFPAHALSWPAVRTVLTDAAALRYTRSDTAFATNPMPTYVNCSLWTIDFELICYVGLAAVAAAGLLRRRRTAAVLTACGVAVAAAGLYVEPAVAARYAPLRHVIEFARLTSLFGCGTVYYLYRDRVRPTLAGVAAVLLALAAVTAAAPALLLLALPPLLTYVVFWAGFHRRVVLPKLTAHADYSYGVYLWGFPVQQTLIYFVPGHFSPWTNTLATLPIALGLAALSWHWVERPAMRLKDVDFAATLARTGRAVTGRALAWRVRPVAG